MKNKKWIKVVVVSAIAAIAIVVCICLGKLMQSEGGKKLVFYILSAVIIFGACVWYKSCGTTNLSTKYDPCYILTGDLEELDFYNLLLTTLIVLKELDKDFNLTQELKEVFINE